MGEKTHPTENSPASSVKQILRNVFDQILNDADIDFIVTLNAPRQRVPTFCFQS